MARRRSRLRRGRVVFCVPPVPGWTPEPPDHDGVEQTRPRLVRRVSRRGAGTFQPVGEAALRTVSDASAVLSVVRR